MNESNNTPKNPLELAQEAFLYGTEKLENSTKELVDFVDYVMAKQQELKVLDDTYAEERADILKIMSSNFELYREVNSRVETNFKVAMQGYQTNFQKLIENSKLTSLNLNDSDRKSLQDTTEQIKNLRKLRYFDFGIIALLAIVMILSGYFTTQFYKSSIQTKSEIRQEILSEMENEGKAIFEIKDFDQLKHNTELMNKWIKNNPKDADGFLKFKEGFESR